MSKFKYVCNKYREELFGHIEENLCLEHYNAIFKLNLKEDECEMHKSRCFFCKEEKMCIVHHSKTEQ